MRGMIVGVLLFAFAAFNVAQGGAVFVIGTLVLLVGASLLDHRLTEARQVIAALEAEILRLQRPGEVQDHAQPNPVAAPTYREFLQTLLSGSAPTRGNGRTPGSSASRR